MLLRDWSDLTAWAKKGPQLLRWRSTVDLLLNESLSVPLKTHLSLLCSALRKMPRPILIRNRGSRRAGASHSINEAGARFSRSLSLANASHQILLPRLLSLLHTNTIFRTNTGGEEMTVRVSLWLSFESCGVHFSDGMALMGSFCSTQPVCKWLRSWRFCLK
jgi:hypothetical protein